MKIRSTCLVALDAACVVKCVNLFSFMDAILVAKGFDIVIEGPGRVYFAADTNKR